MDKPIWRVEAVMYTDTVEDFARKLQKVMNALEEEGYDILEPQQVGKHYFVCGRLPHIVMKVENEKSNHQS